MSEKTVKPSSRPVGEESMVVRLSRLDKMLELAGEVIIVSSNLSAISHQVREGYCIPGELEEDVKDLAITSSRISSDLHNLVTSVRTVDMGDLFARFRRLARDTSRREGKAIRFETHGEDVCIDKKISERIYDPIAHQIRNAISHGIEDEETRRALGKDPVGTVTLSIRNLDNNTVIDITDDGSGIDEHRVRKTILKMGLADERAISVLTGDLLYEYLYFPGFTTSTQTSGTSGRGVGMDVVRTVIINEIGGEVHIQTAPDAGTTFSFVMPLVTAVNISDALLVRAHDTRFAFPIISVIATMSVEEKEVTTTTGKGRSIMYLGSILSLFELMEVFGDKPVGAIDGKLRVIVIEHKKQRVAYVVSEFLSPQKIVISEFDEALTVFGLTGTATLSGRQMAMVVNLPELIEQTFGGGPEIERLLPSPAVLASTCREEAVSSEQEIAAEAEDIDTPDSEFVEELRAMLSRLNREFLLLEEKRDAETADGVFRLVHSIKGNLTMCGAEKASAATHELETILGKARQKEITLDANAFDVLFDGASFLETAVAALETGVSCPDIPERLQTGIAAFTQEKTEAEDRAELIDLDAAQVVPDATGEFYLSSRRREGTPLYQCRIDFEPYDQPRFLIAYLILRRIQGVADVLGSLPSMRDLEAGMCEGGMRVLFAPRVSRPDLVKSLEQNLTRYYGVTRFDTSRYA